MESPDGRRADDFIAIERLILEFAYRFDTGDIDGATAVIGRGSLRYLAGQDVIAEAHNPEEIRRLVGSAQLFDDGTPRTQHVITNIRIDVNESRTAAASSSYVMVMQAADDRSLQMIAAGNYHDRFEKSADGWHFSERVARLQDAVGRAAAPGSDQD